MFNNKFEDIFLGYDAIVALGKDKKLYSVGYNNCQIDGSYEFYDTLFKNFEEIPSLADIKQIESVNYSTYILKNDGTVWVCGTNSSGFLGLGHNRTISNKFIQVPNMDNVKKIASSTHHTAILKEDGTVWVCGYNNDGQLGMGDYIDRVVFTQVPDVSNVKDIGCGSNTTIILKNDGTLWTCGSNFYSQLGLGSNTTIPNVNVFTKVNITNLKEIYCGPLNIFILRSDGLFGGCGNGSYGQLGNGKNAGWYTLGQINVSDIKKVSSSYHTILLKNDGTVWVCGLNANGQLGLGDTTNRNTFTQVPGISNVKDVYAEGRCSFLLKEDGTVWVCGYNTDNLGLGDYNDRNTFTQVPGLDNIEVKNIYPGETTSFLMTTDEKIMACGENAYGNLGIPFYNKYREFTKIDIDNIKKVYYCVDQYFILVLKNDNTLWVKGLNINGKLGTGNYDNVEEFTQVMDNVSDVYIPKDIHYIYNIFIKKIDGTIWSIGDNYCGEGGWGEDIEESLEYRQVNINDIKEIQMGNECTFFIKNDGTLYTCGWTGHGQLGLGIDPVEINDMYDITQVPGIDNVKKVTCGSCFTSVIKNDNTLWITGDNKNGELGLGDTVSRLSFVQVPNMTDVKDVVNTINNSFVIKNDNTLWVTGYNKDGELGLGDLTSTNAFVKVMDDVKSIAYSGSNRAYIIKNDDSIWVSGINESGELGLGDFNNKRNFVKIDNLTSKNLKYIKYYDDAAIMLFNDGTAYYTGENIYNMSGLHQSIYKDYFNEFTKYEYPSEFNDFETMIDGEIVKIIHGTCGKSHEILETEDGKILIRGSNKYGQLGLGDTIDRDEYTELDESVKYAKAVREITIIKKHGEYYVAGKYMGNEFEKYNL